MYYLGTDDCVHRASDDKTLVCDVMDFEVTADKKVYVLVPPNSPADNNDEFVLNTTSSTYYQRRSDSKALTLIRDKPVFIDNDYKAT